MIYIEKSKQEVDYDVLNTILTDAIGKDILNYGVASASINDSKNEVTITYNEVRETKLNKQIIKKFHSVKITHISSMVTLKMKI